MITARLLLFTAFVALAAAAPAAELHVPAVFPTIQAAIDAAQHGDTVKVAPGIYFENIDFKGRSITVTGTGGAEVTTIDGGMAGSVVTFASGEGAGSVLCGFSIRHGVGAVGSVGYPGIPEIPFTFPGTAGGPGGPGKAGGIHCANTSPVIIDCRITDNTGGQGGTGGTGAPAQYPGTYPTANGPGGSGGPGGVGFLGGAPLLVNCIVARNTGGAPGTGGVNATAPTGGNGRGGSGGISVVTSSATIVSTTVTLNAASSTGAGGLIAQNGSPTVTNCIFWNDTSPSGAAEIDPGPGGLVVSSSLVAGGFPGAGILDTDPLLVDPSNDDFHLALGSPCVEAGDAAAAGLSPTDFEGDPRIIASTVDLGADEYQLVRAYPGSDEDFELTTTVNWQLPTANFPVKTVVAQDLLDVSFRSPNATFDGTQTLLLGQAFSTGSPPASPFPAIHVNPFVTPGPTVLFDGGSGPLGTALLPPAGFRFLLQVPPGLSGWSFLLQALSVTQSATNGIFAATDGNEFQVL